MFMYGSLVLPALATIVTSFLILVPTSIQVGEISQKSVLLNLLQILQVLRPALISVSWLLWVLVSILNISLQWLLVMWTSMRIILTMIFLASLNLFSSTRSIIISAIDMMSKRGRSPSDRSAMKVSFSFFIFAQ